MAQTDARPQVLDMVFGFRNAQIVYVAARLGLADLLAGGPRTSADLAKETDTYQPSLYRLLRALAVLGVVQQTDVETFELASAGDPLRADAPAMSATFNAAMSEATRVAVPDIIAGCDFSRFRTVTDVGGGDGTLMAAILAAVPSLTVPSLTGVLFELPGGLERAGGTLIEAAPA
jgi:hypothetical protein